MSMVINHELRPMHLESNMGSAYRRLGESVGRMSPNLSIESAQNDAPGKGSRLLAVPDVQSLQQAVPNANDTGSQIRNAESGLGIIAEKKA